MNKFIFLIVLLMTLPKQSYSQQNRMIDSLSFKSLDSLSIVLQNTYKETSSSKSYFMLKNKISKDFTKWCTEKKNKKITVKFSSVKKSSPFTFYLNDKELIFKENTRYKYLYPFLRTTKMEASTVYWYSHKNNNFAVIYLEPLPTITATPRVVFIIDILNSEILYLETRQYHSSSTFPRLILVDNNFAYIKYDMKIIETAEEKIYNWIGEIYKL